MSTKKEEELIKRIEELEGQVKTLSSNKKYGLVYKEQPEEVEESYKDKIPVLKSEQSLDICNGGQQNLLIEGDNFHVLKSLQPTHMGKVDVIYIDPPYNTGNQDFVYNDRYVDTEDTWRHSTWLSFMAKRLKLAKRLLSDDGLIFISIDDNEQAQLKLLMDEIFGEKNCVGVCPVINNMRGRNDSIGFATCHEYLIVYSKTNESFSLNGREVDEKYMDEFDLEDGYGKYKEVLLRKTGKASSRSDRPNMFYPIFYSPSSKNISLEKTEDGIEILPKDTKGNESRWTWGKEKFLLEKDKNISIREVNGNWNVFKKMRLEIDGQTRSKKQKSAWINPSYDSANGVKQIKDVLGEKVFDNPKPIQYIKDIISLCSNKAAIVLDFFAGSGTTGQAVLELNREDGGNRRFILVTNNENNICRAICHERIRRLLKGECADNRPAEEGSLRFFINDFVIIHNNKNQLRMNYKKAIVDLMCVANYTFDKMCDNKDFAIYTNDKISSVLIKSFIGFDALKDQLKLVNLPIKIYYFDNCPVCFHDLLEGKQVLDIRPIPEKL